MDHLREALRRASSLPSQSEKLAAYTRLLEEILPGNDAASLAVYVDGITDPALGLVIARQAITQYIERIKTHSRLDSHVRVSALEHLLGRTQPRLVSFEDQVTLARMTLADLYERDEDWHGAAKTLQEIPLESGQRNVSDEFKLSIYLRIAQISLEGDDPVIAEAYLNRAAAILSPEAPRSQQLVYKLSQARILDAKRRFLEASGRYLEVSHASEIDRNDRMQSLMASVTCAILAPAGPQRSRLLSALMKDERIVKLPEFYSTLLEKMFLERMIQSDEVAAFVQSLSPHQKAKLADGQTVFQRAVTEHNLLGASKIYSNIYFDSLGRRLGLSSGDAAEEFARKMIEQGRLKASIDQVNRLIDFERASVADDTLGGVGSAQVDQSFLTLRKWDRSIKDINEKVEAVITLMKDVGPSAIPVSS